jgi:hypothetical protein
MSEFIAGIVALWCAWYGVLLECLVWSACLVGVVAAWWAYCELKKETGAR